MEKLNVKKKCMVMMLCLFGLALMFAGCTSAEEREQARQWREQASENAVVYIKDKYGFEATVVDSETQRVSGLFGTSLTSWTLVTMEYEGKEFSVLIDAHSAYMEDASDNYQKKEIQAAFAEEVCRFLQVKPDRLRMTIGDNKDAQWYNSDAFYDSFFHEYFDGSNLEDVLLDYDVVCVAEMVSDADVDALYAANTNPMFEHENMCMLIVTYESEADMRKCNIPVLEDDELETDVYENAMYVSDALFIDYSVVIPYDISIGQCADFYYMSVGTDISEYNITAATELHDASEWNGRGAIDATAIDDTAYYVEGNIGRKLYIYYPKDKYPKSPGAGDKKVRMASKWISDNTGEYVYDFSLSTDIVEDYEVFWAYAADCEDFSFRFLYDNK